MHIREDAALPALPKSNPLPESFPTNWAPLEALCPPGLCEQFMYMGRSCGIFFYKHVDSRRYLNVDLAGLTYAYDAALNTYYRIPVSAAMLGLVQDSLVDSVEAVRVRS
jgi:hypothetical protein